ncbi:MAG: hypothetical protein ABI068_05550 [Ktedonobacterales bacterium]
MAIQLATVQEVLEGALAVARATPYASEPIYETALFSLRTLLATQDDPMPPGWLRAVAPLCDTRRRLGIDALGASRRDQLQTRIAALLDVPPVESVAGLADIESSIAAAINVGAPRYNAGDIAGCCIKYWVTMQALIGAPVLRGFTGYARIIAQFKAVVEAEPAVTPYDSRGVDALAWELRHAFDNALRAAG